MTVSSSVNSLHVGIIGLGLIGASIAAGLKQRHPSIRISGCDQNAETLTEAQRLQWIDAGYEQPAQLCECCDLIIIAVPVLGTHSVLTELAPALHKHPTVLTDVGSVKGVVAAAAEAVFGEMPAWFIPGHPIAGSEYSGIAAADADLFCHHGVILTPNTASSERAIATLTELWETLGAQVTTMSVAHHDEILAGTSHLPHLLSFALVDCLAQGSDQYEMFEFAAGGFRDFTRIAASDPTMWHDIALSNSTAILMVLTRYQAQLERVREALEQQDGASLKAMFGRAKKGRDHFAQRLNNRQGKAS